MQPSQPANEPAHTAPRAEARAPAKHAPLRPPQFLVVSFDGSGGVRLWPYWRSVARRAHAHFTFFVSGVYLLDEHSRLYHPPRHSAGASDIGFACSDGPRAAAGRARDMPAQIAAASAGARDRRHWRALLPRRPGSVSEWDAADWAQELVDLGGGRSVPRSPVATTARPAAIAVGIAAAAVATVLTPVLIPGLPVLIAALVAIVVGWFNGLGRRTRRSEPATAGEGTA